MGIDPEDITDDIGVTDSSFTDIDGDFGDSQLMFTHFSGMTEEEEGTPDDDLITEYGDNEPPSAFPPGGTTGVASYKGGGAHKITSGGTFEVAAAPTADNEVVRKRDMADGDIIMPRINFNEEKTTYLLWDGSTYLQLYVNGTLVTRWYV